MEVLLWLCWKATAVCLSGCKQLFCDLLWLREIKTPIPSERSPPCCSNPQLDWIFQKEELGFFELSALFLSAWLTATGAHVCVAHWGKEKRGVFGAGWLNKICVGKGCVVVKDVLGCQGSIWCVLKGPGLRRLSRILSAVTPVLLYWSPSCICAVPVTDGSLASPFTEQ